MISKLSVRNFRCYRDLSVSGFGRLNVIVGDNGVGKTALLESLFLPLSTATEVALRLRQYRGASEAFQGPARRIEEAVLGDYFFDRNMSLPISLLLAGDGIDNRSLLIQRGSPEAFLPEMPAVGPPGVYFVWGAADGSVYPVLMDFTASNAGSRGTPEDMASFFFFGSTGSVPSAETAGRFSELSKVNAHRQVVEAFAREYPWIGGISVEVDAGAPVLYADLKSGERKLPLASISGGINRVASILLAIASKASSVTVVDEIENGIYFKHFEATWRSILAFLRNGKGQMFASTHSEECLKALLAVAGRDVDDIALFRLERSDGQPTVRRFGGKTLKAGISAGSEVR